MSVILVSSPKTGLTRWEPMAYGRGNDPSPNLLMIRPGLATTFECKDLALAALHTTLAAATAAGHTWPKRLQFNTCELLPQPT